MWTSWLWFPLTVRGLNTCGPLWCLSTVIGGFISVLVTSPHLYKDLSKYWITVNQIVAVFLFAQLISNWLCVRYVGSEYSPLTEDKYSEQVAGLPRAVSEAIIITDADKPPVKIAKDLREIRSQSPLKMYVVSGFSTETGLPKRTAYPYWSWVPCVLCQHSRPPRCHHCSLCRQCVLKRDHHCFFTGSCVGFRNTRHFIVFCFWAVFACMFSLVHCILYYYHFLWEQTMTLDVFPVTVHVRWILGYCGCDVALLTSLMWSCVFFCPLAADFFYSNLKMAHNGQTSFERENGIHVSDSRPRPKRLQSVFGRHWILNFVIPIHTVFPADEDPVFWPFSNY